MILISLAFLEEIVPLLFQNGRTITDMNTFARELAMGFAILLALESVLKSPH